MLVIYRTSPDGSGYNKQKPDYINEIGCLRNFISYFLENDYNLYEGAMIYKRNRPTLLVVADTNYFNGDSVAIHNYMNTIQSHVPANSTKFVNFGSGSKVFNWCLTEALECSDDEIVYFVENDYLHVDDSYLALIDGLKLGDYVSLYNHPDKFIAPQDGGNPYVESDGGFYTKLFSTDMATWMLTNSLTGTFAAKVSVLRRDEEILREFTSGTSYRDFEMFIELQRKRNRRILTPIPTYSTHGETAWLAKRVDWTNYAYY